MTMLCIRLFAVILALLAIVPASQAASIGIGGIRLHVPGVVVEPRVVVPPYQYREYRGSVSGQPRWHIVIQEGHTFATNDQGVWVGHDDAGNMVMQIAVGQLGTTDQKVENGTTMPVQIDINGRFFATVPAIVANEHMIVVQGDDVERILGGLMRGSRLRVLAGTNILEMHLRGSSAAIGEVRRAAAMQRSLVAQGLVKPAPKEPAADTDAIRYFLPGVEPTGVAEVRFNIVEGAGLMLYAKFYAIPGHGDPEYALPMTKGEATRAVALIRKGKQWTDIAVKNHVGLFSKRIGFFDDVHGADPAATETGGKDDSAGKAAENTETDSGIDIREKTAKPDEAAGANEATSNETAGNETAGNETAGNETAGADQATPSELTSKSEDPQDFKAVNFNSYEDGSTSIQIEHAVKGFSRRFNLSLENALKLADSLEATINGATSKLEKREYDTKEKDKLFQ